MRRPTPSVPGTLCSRLCSFLLLCLALLQPSQLTAQSPLASPPSPTEPAPRKGPTHDVIDEATLRSKAHLASQQISALAAKTKPVASPPSTQSSLLTSSILISDGTRFTIVPIGSVLHLPAALHSKIIPKPQGDILLWPDFLKQNASWIAAKEVSLAMSRGDTKAASAVLREVSGDTRLVVAVYAGCPITILEPAKTTETSPSKTLGNR